MKTFRFRVEVDVDDAVSEAELREYIQVAVAAWGGQFHPSEPLFHLEEEDVRVVRHVKRK
jgi:hypothetical protein